MIGLGAEAGSPRCSRAGCSNAAAWAVLWRNPRIHGVDRRKTWLACAGHVDFLRDYLAARDFPVEVTPFHEAVS
ncbi:hypothetical protein OH146_01365 [Salinibacterium sp. SYSU T00001]|uniref:hypothetical protein n=1 Tax=Homoserinimonas sedimenticola TaxID=2986805 RepID=UPI002236923A|nr:hypothetical protein [Salinibacterium sedimenticola]MCW4384417.1 hypothetical protein [Salinibacterium sedimenticola]